MVQLSISSAALLLVGLLGTASAATTCTVATTSGDAASNIAAAFESCKSGGTVSFPKGNSYTLKSMLSISGLQGTTVDFAGTINLGGYDTSLSGGSAYLTIKGDSITFAGGGTINGNGQGWWDAKDTTAPTVLRITATNSDFGHFTIKNSPRAHMGLTSSDNVNLHDVTLNTVSSNSNLPKNTDGLDVSSSTNIVFQNSVLTIGDDCTAINGGVTNITLSNIDCTNGHGFSVGSLGKAGATQYVKTVRVLNSKCTNCQNGVRIKTWPGGKGSVTDVKYQDVNLVNVENPILITTHYCDNNQQSYCTGNDADSLSISGVTIDNVYGSAANKALPIFSVNCSSNAHCSNFAVTKLAVTKAAKTTSNVCVYLDGSSSISACSA